MPTSSTIVETILNRFMTQLLNYHLESVHSSSNITITRIFLSNILFIKLNLFIYWFFISISLSLIRIDSNVFRPNFTHLYNGVYVCPKHRAKFHEHDSLVRYHIRTNPNPHIVSRSRNLPLHIIFGRMRPDS